MENVRIGSVSPYIFEPEALTMTGLGVILSSGEGPTSVML